MRLLHHRLPACAARAHSQPPDNGVAPKTEVHAAIRVASSGRRSAVHTMIASTKAARRPYLRATLTAQLVELLPCSGSTVHGNLRQSFRQISGQTELS